MSVRKSQAFAAYRTELVTEMQGDVLQTLVPSFNAEIVDIRKSTEETKQLKGEALADHHKRARIQDLKVRQQDFIDGLNAELTEKLSKRVDLYGGKIEEKENEAGKKVLEATFSDGSVARMPKSLWIDYNLFDRV